MSRRTPLIDRCCVAWLMALAGSLGCATGGGSPGTGEAGAELASGSRACTAEGDHAYPGSGIVQCSGRFLHRDQGLACQPDLLRPEDEGYPARRSDATANSSCYADEDCRGSPDGHCVLRGAQLLCVYGCREDSDCGSTQLCLCGEELAGTCVAADCRTDADCPAGSLCTGPADLDDPLQVHFACQQASDECAGDAQCGSQLFCHFDPALGHKVCRGHGPSPARP